MTARLLRTLHVPGRPVVLPNVWDTVSARVFADAGFGALATTSSGVAATLGYADGEQTPADEMFAAVGRIARAAGVPVTADVEAGYGLAPAELVDRLLAAGAVGCNLEDSRNRVLVDAAEQADRLAAVRAAAGDALVVNARVDVHLLHAGETADAVARGNGYLAAGADCVYPILAPATELPALVAGIAGPVNALQHPGGPSVAELRALGVARITFGGTLHAQATDHLRTIARTLQ